jgi:hypothetical protein
MRRHVPRSDDLGEQFPFCAIGTCIIGGIMLTVQLGVFLAVFLGVRDNQGIIYAVAIPFLTDCVGLPVALSLAIRACLRRERRRAVWAGIWLTFSGPLMYALFVFIRTSGLF